MTINYFCDSLLGCQTAAGTAPPPHLPPRLSPHPTHCLLTASTWIICPETSAFFVFLRVASFAIKDSPRCRLWRSAFKCWQVPSLRKFGFTSLSICRKGKRLVSAGGSLRKASLEDNPPHTPAQIRNITVTAASDAAPLVTDKHIIRCPPLVFLYS